MIRQYVQTVLFVIPSVLLFACSDAQNKQLKPNNQTQNKADFGILLAKAEVSNPSSFDRQTHTQYFSYYDLGLNDATEHIIQAAKLSAPASSENLELLSSEAIDLNLDGKLDGVLVSLPLLADETSNIAFYKVPEKPALTKQTQAEISHKVGGEWLAHSKYPDTDYREYQGGNYVNVIQLTPPAQYTDHSNWIRYEGPGIESDKVAYRIYADWRNGFDIFGKLTHEPILQLVGQNDYQSYHEMQDWGMDILKVGQSLGAGGFGLWHDDKLSLVSDVQQRSISIIENGALRSSFAIDYRAWQSPIGTLDLRASFSMHAGSSLVRTSIDLSSAVETMAMGVVKHENTELLVGSTDITDKAYTYIASWGNQALDGSPLGMAIFFRKENLEKVTSDEANYIAVLSPKGMPNQHNPKAHQIHYYFDASWGPNSGIDSKNDYATYLNQEAEKLTIQARVIQNTLALPK